MFTVTKGIPIPKNNARYGRSKYPFGEMEVGDSFFIPLAPTASLKVSVYRAARVNYGVKRSIRIAAEKSGMRVWRVK